MKVSVELFISSSSVYCSSVVQIFSGTCHKLVQTSYSSGTMLDGGSLATYSSQHVGRHSSSISHHKGSHCGCFSRLSDQGSANAAFNPLAAQRYVLHRQGFSSLVCQAVVGETQVSTMKV